MTERPEWVARCTAPPVVRARWYRALASALVATAPPGGVVFESTNRDPTPVVTVRPGTLVETVRATPGVGSVALEAVAAHAAPRPPSGWPDRLRQLLSPPSSGGLIATTSGILREPPDLSLVLGHRGWVGTQTHWLRGDRGEIWVARRVRIAAPDRATLADRLEPVATALALDWSRSTGTLATSRPLGPRAYRDWRRGTVRTVPREAWLPRSSTTVERTAELAERRGSTDLEEMDGHAVVFGASGSGKTTYLARRAASHAERRGAVVVIDLHGDLAPAVAARLSAATRARTLAIDATDRPTPGVAVLAVGDDHAERAAAHLVAGLKRLSPDGTELYWGFRLERIFDTLVRHVRDTGGSLLDLYGLLTDADRRDAARLETRRPEVARFLDELGPVVKRTPDFLWSAATRLSKVVLVPALAELLAPADGGLPVEELLEEGRSLLVRLPFSALGPEAAAFAGTLLLGRIYLGLAARREGVAGGRTVLVVLDEVQGFAPRLVAELLTESRKFGLRVLVATQYPDRLAPETRAAVAGAPTEFVTFRVPRVLARSVGPWLGLPPDDADRTLSELPVGAGVRLGPESPGPRSLSGETRPPREGRARWIERVAATRDEFGATPAEVTDAREDDRATDRLLLAVLAATERGDPIRSEGVVAAALALPGRPPDSETLGRRWRVVKERGFVEETPAGVVLTGLGERTVGLTRPTGATRESDEHRALLLATFRLFARRGYLLEIVRQGRYDTTLPDARFVQLPDRDALTPAELAESLARRRGEWAWRFFRGRDVHVEAEVSGALRPERIRRGWSKASARGAFALFVVGDAGRAGRVRRTLRALALGPDRAQVWTLRVSPVEVEIDRTRRPNA